MSIKKEIVYVNTDTGEVLKYLRFSIEKEYLISLRDKARFVKSFSSQSSFPKILNGKWAWIGYWLYLQKYHIEQHTNLLIKVRRPNFEYDIIPIETQKDIAEVLNVTERTVQTFVKACIDDLLIKKGEDGYVMNPYYGYNGAGVHPETCLLFRDSKVLWDALTPLQKEVIQTYQNKMRELKITDDDILHLRESMSESYSTERVVDITQDV